jgi:hypothetical protein
MVNVTNQKVRETWASLYLYVSGTLAESDHRRIRPEEHPQFKQETSTERDPALQLGAECFEPMRASWSHKRDRFDQRKGQFHEIHAFKTGFEV